MKVNLDRASRIGLEQSGVDLQNLRKAHVKVMRKSEVSHTLSSESRRVHKPRKIDVSFRSGFIMMLSNKLFRQPFCMALLLGLLTLPACQPAPGGAVQNGAGPDAENIESAVDGERLLGHVEVLASDAYMGRRAGEESGRMALEYVEGQMMDMDLAAACGNSLRQEFSFEGRSGSVDATNLIAIIKGTSQANGSIVLSAHFDHLGERGGDIYNGADDNASGTAALLEIARAVSEHPLSHNLILAAVDAEEMGLRGARDFVASDCFDALDVRLNINMDMISRSPAGELYATGTYHYPFLKPMLEKVSQPQGLTLLFGHDEPGTGGDDWTNASDHAPFHAEGIPFVYFGVEDHPGYHNPSDDFEDITPEFFKAAASFIHDALRSLDGTLSDFPDA